MLRVEEVAGAAAMESLAADWRALFDATPDASPFQSPAWLLAWLRAFRPQTPFALAAWGDRSLVGVLPLFIWRRPEDGRRQLTLLGNGVSDRLDLLAAPGREAEVADAVFAHLRGTTTWDACDWRDLPQGSPLVECPLGPVRLDVLEDEEPCPARSLPDAPEAVVAALPRKRRENLQRRRRRLAEIGEVRFRTADSGSRPAFLAELMRLHASRWAERDQAGVLAEAKVFHQSATAALLADGLLRLAVLELDGRVIAAHYGLHRGTTAYSYIHGFDPAFSTFGPSALLIAQAMGDAVREGGRRFDFLRGREGYKYDWGATDQRQVRRRVER